VEQTISATSLDDAMEIVDRLTNTSSE
jgi:hypothetical protein